jgi:hypothetical protein
MFVHFKKISMRDTLPEFFKCVKLPAHNACNNAIHGHINDFLVRTGLRAVSEL